MLSSEHPLTDSLSALTAGPIGSGTLTIIDTFSVEAVQDSGEGKHTVRVRFPRSVRIQSGSWTTSSPTVDAQRTLRIRQDEVVEGPHVVGWPAFQRHLREVAPAAADTVLERAGTKLGRSPDRPAGP